CARPTMPPGFEENKKPGAAANSDAQVGVGDDRAGIFAARENEAEVRGSNYDEGDGERTQDRIVEHAFAGELQGEDQGVGQEPQQNPFEEPTQRQRWITGISSVSGKNRKKITQANQDRDERRPPKPGHG